MKKCLLTIKEWERAKLWVKIEIRLKFDIKTLNLTQNQLFRL